MMSRLQRRQIKAHVQTIIKEEHAVKPQYRHVPHITIRNAEGNCGDIHLVSSGTEIIFFLLLPESRNPLTALVRCLFAQTGMQIFSGRSPVVSNGAVPTVIADGELIEALTIWRYLQLTNKGLIKLTPIAWS